MMEMTGPRWRPTPGNALLTILILEDDPLIGSQIEAHLAQAGYRAALLVLPPELVTAKRLALMSCAELEPAAVVVDAYIGSEPLGVDLLVAVGEASPTIRRVLISGDLNGPGIRARFGELKGVSLLTKAQACSHEILDCLSGCGALQPNLLSQIGASLHRIQTACTLWICHHDDGSREKVIERVRYWLRFSVPVNASAEIRRALVCLENEWPPRPEALAEIREALESRANRLDPDL